MEPRATHSPIPREILTIPYLTVNQIEEFTGIAGKTIQNWLDRGLLTEYLSNPSPGRGGRRLYSIADLVLFQVAAAVSEFGISPRVAVSAGVSVRAWMLTESARRRDARKLGQQFFVISESEALEAICSRPTAADAMAQMLDQGILTFVMIAGGELISRVLDRIPAAK